jgi:hypothetical protein
VTPARAQLLGLEHYIASPKVEFSADITMSGDGDSIQGKVYRALDKERREVTVEGDSEVIIIRLDRKLVWSLAPEEKLYTESSLDQALGREPDAGGAPRDPQLTVKTLGKETVEGHATTKQRVTGKDVDGTPIEGTLWVTPEGIVLRADTVVIDDDGARHQARMELHNLRIERQDPRLFEVPAGFKRVAPSRLGAAEGRTARLLLAGLL